VRLWEGEKRIYTGEGGPMRPEDMAAGHYTQVVWGKSRTLGCGRVACRADGWDWTIVSCNYSPGGNQPGERVY